MRGITGRTTRTIVLLAALMVLPGQQSLHLLPQPAALADSPTAPATVTTPEPESPVSVAPATGSYVGGVGNAAAPVGDTAGKSLPSDVLAAYTLAIAVAPPGCHLTLPLLAAIGQVESGNLAGHAVDAKNRVTPAIIGPVLNGKGDVRAVPDTDGGQWDGDKKWDRALGPFQFIPSSWRVAGVDMDADGVRDPQNIFDAAGAAMVYLCAGGRDLATASGLRQGVLAYNHSTSYLEARAGLEGGARRRRPQRGRRADGLRRLGAADHADRGSRRPLGRGRHPPARRLVTQTKHSTPAAKPTPTGRPPAPATPSTAPAPAPATPRPTPTTPSPTPTPTADDPDDPDHEPEAHDACRTPADVPGPHRRRPDDAAPPATPPATPVDRARGHAGRRGRRGSDRPRRPVRRPRRPVRATLSDPTAGSQTPPDALTLTLSRTASASSRTRSAGPDTR